MKDKILITQSSMPSYEEYIEAIKPLWNSHCLTNMGDYHMELEQKLKSFLKVDGISMMVNGHMALELAIQAMGFPSGAEVITTPFTFISTTHAIMRNNLVPVFCDVKLSDGTIDESKIEELITEKTAAILPVHVYGHLCNVTKIQSIADRYNLKVIYDAAHAFGVTVKDKGIGTFGDASIFSFHATKVFNTIEGGAVAFKEHKMYDKLYDLKNFGIRGEEVVADIGANAKMNEFCAIMGLCNLKHIDDSIRKRKICYDRYEIILRDKKGIRLFEKPDYVKSNYAYFPIVVEDDFSINREKLYQVLRENNIYSRKYFYPLTSDQACFKNKYKHIKLENARFLSDRILVLPLYEDLDVTIIDEICKVITNNDA